MDIKDFNKLAESYFEKHNLFNQGWDFKYDNAKRRLGLCDDSKKIITFSKVFIPINDTEILEDTILHEIAHALVGSKNGHNRTWKKKAIEIGAEPKACTDNSMLILPTGPYMFQCKCKIHYYHRKTVLNCNRYCKICGYEGPVCKTNC